MVQDSPRSFLMLLWIACRNIFNHLVLYRSSYLGGQQRSSDIFEYSFKKLHFFFHHIFV